MKKTDVWGSFGHGTLSRRTILGGVGLGLIGFVPVVSRADEPAAGASQPSSTATAASLPVDSTGLEHLGVIVPDVTVAGKFYGRLFNPELYKEKDPPLRYYVTLGVGYLALGSHADGHPAYFDHFCALVKDYNPAAMAEQLKARGLPPGRYGIVPDPDKIGLQLLAVPGGLAKSTEPAGRLNPEEALVRPQHLAEVVLRVTDLETSLGFYRQFFGPEMRLGNKTGAAAFKIAATRLVLEPVAAGEAPKVDRIVVNVAPFDKKTVTRELTHLGATVVAQGKGLRLTDPFGLTVELNPV